MVPATTKMAKRGFLASDRSTSGHRTLFSTTTNAASTTSEPPNAISVQPDSHPQLGARSKVNVNNPIPAMIRASPAMSRRRGAVSSDDSVMLHAPMISEATVSGTFSQKIHRQPTVSVSSPPINGPTALPNPAMP